MRIVLSVLGILLLFLASCQSDKGGECRIYGEMADHSRDGKMVYLVPLIRPDSVGVDSTVITDGKFEFRTRECRMSIVRVELLSRYGLQDLLVVTEPGDVWVKIDSVSSSGGTPQNEVLQQWKEYTQDYGRAFYACRQKRNAAFRAGDTTAANGVQVEVDSLQRVYRNKSRALIEGLAEGALRDFLAGKFPAEESER